jgi:hypothetical protein
MRAECSQRCHCNIAADFRKSYYYQNSLFGKQASNQKSAAAGEYFSFAYTNILF